MAAPHPDLSALEDRLRAAVLALAEDVRAAGGRLWLVGGAVRDLLSGGPPVKDADVEVFGLAPERLQAVVARRFAFDACGASFGVLKLKGLAIDVALPRRETKRGEGHRAFAIAADPFMSVSEAARRRDFTLNALYFDPLSGTLEDPCGGARDLAAKVLRHVSERFVEDPLRVLRGMQFVARFDLTPAAETVALCRTVTMENLPPERLFEEWAKLLVKGVKISKGLDFLRQTRWVGYFPELKRLIGCKQDPAWHPEGDVWNHTCLSLDAFARRRTGIADEDLIVGLAVLCHDFGKPLTTRFDPVKGHVRSLGHDEKGVAPTLSFLRRLTNEERILREVPPLVKCHMQPFAMWRGKCSDAAVRRLAVKVVRIDRLIRVARADDEGRPEECRGGSSAGADLVWLGEVAERLKIADAAPKPILRGRDLMALGYAPSPRFGLWLKACFEAQLDGSFSDLPGAVRYFREHVAPRP